MAAVAVARELLGSTIGDPKVSGNTWTWRGDIQEGPGKLENREQVVPAFGTVWYYMIYGSLPGNPESYISPELFKTAVLKYTTFDGMLAFGCERDRYLNGHLVTMRGMVARHALYVLVVWQLTLPAM